MLTDAPSDLRTQLIDAAGRLLRAKGVAALTTREIAREAGCSDGALYTHFPCKSDLLAAVCEETLPDVRRRMGDLVRRVGTSTVERNLEEMVLALQEFMRELVPLVSAVAADQNLRTRHRERYSGEMIPPKRTLVALADYVSAEQRIGRVGSHVVPVVAGSMIMGACYGDAMVQHVFGETIHGMTQQRYARALARSAWQGMAPLREKAT